MQSIKTTLRREIELDGYAWRSRRAPTDSEARLWEALRGRKLGVQFRRQVVIGGRYIVDFAAPSLKLVVEVDGSYHRLRRSADARRDRGLAMWGWSVVRLSNQLVLLQLEVAVTHVMAAAGCRR